MSAHRVSLIALLLAAPAVLAQSAGGHAGHHAAPAPAAAAPAMDHGEMQMQGGAAPADARDPHADSGGYTLERGPYTQEGPRSLHLADEHRFARLRVDRLERVDSRDATATVYDVQGRIGRDYTYLALKAEGDYADGRLADAHTEVRYARALDSYWDGHLGLRHDTGSGPDRTWLGLGVQGLAPYWFELDASVYVGSAGRSALVLEAEYELLLTQRLVLEPRAELAVHGKADRANGVGSGLSDAAFGLRLRYEITRQFAPYIGIEWHRKFGQSAAFARDDGEAARETRTMAGVRFWF